MYKEEIKFVYKELKQFNLHNKIDEFMSDNSLEEEFSLDIFNYFFKVKEYIEKNAKEIKKVNIYYSKLHYQLKTIIEFKNINIITQDNKLGYIKVDDKKGGNTTSNYIKFFNRLIKISVIYLNLIETFNDMFKKRWIKT